MTTPWPSAPAKPPISGADLTISIVSLVLTLLLGASAAVMGFFVVTIVQLVRRSPAWPFAVGTLVLRGVICAFGFAGYFAAVGAGRVSRQRILALVGS